MISDPGTKMGLRQASVQTTGGWFCIRQNLVRAVNDNLPIDPELARFPGSQTRPGAGRGAISIHNRAGD